MSSDELSEGSSDKTTSSNYLKTKDFSKTEVKSIHYGSIDSRILDFDEKKAPKGVKYLLNENKSRQINLLQNIDLVNNDNINLQKKVEELTANLNHAKDKIHDLRSHIAQLEVEKTKADQRILLSNAEYLKLVKEHEVDQMTLIKLRSSISELENENEELREQISKKPKENIRFPETQISLLKRKNKKLISENISLKKNAEYHLATIESQNRTIASMRSDIANQILSGHFSNSIAEVHVLSEAGRIQADKLAELRKIIQDQDTKLMSFQQPDSDIFEKEISKKTKEIAEAREVINNLQTSLQSHYHYFSDIKGSIEKIVGYNIDTNAQSIAMAAEDAAEKHQSIYSINLTLTEKLNATSQNSSLLLEKSIHKLRSKFERRILKKEKEAEKLKKQLSLRELEITKIRTLKDCSLEVTTVDEDTIKKTAQLEGEKEALMKKLEAAENRLTQTQVAEDKARERIRQLEKEMKEKERENLGALAEKERMWSKSQNLVSTLQNEKERLESEIEMLKHKAEGSYQTASQLSHALNETKEVMSKSLDQFKMKEAELLRTISSLQEQVDVLRDKASSLEMTQRSDDSEQKIRELKESNEKMSQTHDIVYKGLTKKINSAESQLENVRRANEELVQSLKESQEELKKIPVLEEKLKKLETSFQAQKKVLHDTQTDLIKAESELRKVKIDYTSLNERLQEVTKDRDRETAECERLRTQINVLASESAPKALIDSLLGNSNMEIESMQQTLSAREDNIQKLRKLNNELNNKVANLQTLLEKARSTEKKDKAKIEKYKNRIEEHEKENRRLVQELEELQLEHEDTIRNYKAEATYSKEETTKSIAKISGIMKEKATLEQQLEQCHEKLKETEARLHEASSKIDLEKQKYEEIVNKLNETVASLEKKIAKLEGYNANVQERIDDYVRQTSAAKKEAQESNRERDRLNHVVSDLNQEITRLKSEFKNTVPKSEVAFLRLKVSELQKLVKSENSRIILSNFSQVNQAEQRVDELARNEDSLLNEMSGLKQEIAKKQQIIQALQSELKDMRAKVKVLEAPYVDTCPRAFLTHSNNALSQAEQRISELSKSKDILTHQYSTLQDMYNRIKKSTDDFISQISAPSFQQMTNKEKLRFIEAGISSLSPTPVPLASSILLEYKYFEDVSMQPDTHALFKSERNLARRILKSIQKIVSSASGTSEDKDLYSTLQEIHQNVKEARKLHSKVCKKCNELEKTIQSQHLAVIHLSESSVEHLPQKRRKLNK